MMTHRASRNQTRTNGVNGPIGDEWYRAKDGALVSIREASSIQVVIVNGVATLLASYRDGIEIMLGQFDNESKAWRELDLIEEQIRERHRLTTTRIRLGHG